MLWSQLASFFVDHKLSILKLIGNLTIFAILVGVYLFGRHHGAAKVQALWEAEKTATILAAAEIKDKQQKFTDITGTITVAQEQSRASTSAAAKKELDDEINITSPVADPCIVPAGRVRAINKIIRANSRAKPAG